MKTQKVVFWMGVAVLVGGVILFDYSAFTIPGLFKEMRELYANLVETAVDTGMGPSPFQIVEQQLFLMQLLQLVGLGMAVLGAVILTCGLWLKKESKLRCT